MTKSWLGKRKRGEVISSDSATKSDYLTFTTFHTPPSTPPNSPAHDSSDPLDKEQLPTLLPPNLRRK